MFRSEALEAGVEPLSTIRDKHTVVIFARGAGLGVECACCEEEVGFTHQSEQLVELQKLAESHFREVQRGQYLV